MNFVLQTVPYPSYKYMNPMLTTILVVVAFIVVAFIVFVALRPPDFTVTRSAKIAAPPPAVFAQVNDLRCWKAWSPWEGLDPALKRTYEGPAQGTGAIYRWAGNAKVGQGSMTITESRPDEIVRFKIEFLKPFKATNTTEFTFKPVGEQTQVTWTMSGRCNFVTKAMKLFMSMDKMIGTQFEKGLAQLNTVASSAKTEARV